MKKKSINTLIRCK